MEGVTLTLLVFHQVSPEDVTPVGREEMVDGRVARQAQLTAQGGVFDADHRLLVPSARVEEAPHQHLLGRQSAIRGAAVELLREVDGEGLHRGDAVAIKEVQAPEAVGRLAGHDQGVGRRLTPDGQEDEREEGPAAQAGVGEQSAEGAARIDEQSDEGGEEQSVAGVSDGDAVGIGVDGQVTAGHVGVVSVLIEPDGAEGEDAVHRRFAAEDGLAVADGEVGRIVALGRRSGVVVDAEAVEGDAEGQPPLLGGAVGPFGQVGVDSFALSEVDDAARGRQVRQQGAEEDDDEGGVHQQRAPPPDASLHDPRHAQGRQ